MHYSFDYAQQVHLPSNHLQPGPIYLLTPRQVGLFGICCEGFPRQVNFVWMKATPLCYRLEETSVHLHCDNCSGQNKNKYILWHLAWRVATGLHKSITLNFLVAGHTKFAPDLCIGLLKQEFRRHAVSSLECMRQTKSGSMPPPGLSRARLIYFYWHLDGISRKGGQHAQFRHLEHRCSQMIR
ncbi:hypothetical protein CAPTEDRAFT_217555 [Capitella teleta]|uniref:DUF7869 domain-containing protein n=1 Tax=Capitella teleta TaxID=283909 RepID=R7VFG0_CAPTE|nr:hypothetical protein CAPTEDRAFT_217555 [Capitella teleta]|eukprot:ELU14415.1 hypothetical protein CAPTEDRAFT_217555 [Capitella teleta]